MTKDRAIVAISSSGSRSHDLHEVMNGSSVTPAIRTPIAVFDFDGTLTRSDSLVSFLRYAVGDRQIAASSLTLSAVVAAWKFGMMTNARAKQAVICHFFRGWAEPRFSACATQFALCRLPTLIRGEAFERLRWHQAAGHKVIVLTASLESYVRPWATTVGIPIVLGTKVEVCEGLLTGRFGGANCFGPNKVERLRETLQDIGRYYVYAYGNSRGDRELLGCADEPYYRTFTRIAAYPDRKGDDLRDRFR